MTTNADELTPEQIAGMSIEELSNLAGDIPSEDDDSDTGASQTPADEDGSTQEVDGKAAESDDQTGKASEGEPEKKAEEQPVGVATKDGGNIIPYSVLEATRQSEKNAKSQVNSLTDENKALKNHLEEMKNQLEQIKSGKAVEGIKFKSEEEIEAIAEEFPEIADYLRTMQEALQTQTGAQAQYQAEKQAQQQEQAQNVAQLAIDNVPKLAHIQANNPRLFNMAIDIDDELRADPEMQGLTLEQRFEKVVAKLEAEIGFEIKLEEPAKKEIKPDKAAPATALGDIQGGNRPAVDEAQALLERPAHELANRFNDMSAEAIHNFLDKVSF